MPIIDDFKIEDWLPMPPDMGPPLPRHLGIYWPFYAPPGAEFRVSNPVIQPAEVQVGYPVTISCLVTNIGSEAGSYTVTLGGDFVAKQTVTLDPGESKVVAFEVTPTVAKTYSVSVDGLTGSFKAIEVLANLHGVVTNADTGLPLSGVKVTLKAQIAQTYTKADGSYRFEGLTPDPTFAVFFEKDGYDTGSKMLALTEGDNVLNIALSPTVVPKADIRLENLTIEPAEVFIGEKVTISVTAKNYGTAAGSRTITCNVT